MQWSDGRLARLAVGWPRGDARLSINNLGYLPALGVGAVSTSTNIL